MGNLTLFIGAFLVPLCAIFANLFIRHAAKTPTSAGADALMFFLTLDGSALIASSDFIKLVPYPEFQKQFSSIFVGLLFISFAFWALNIAFFEKKIGASFNHKTGQYTNYPFKTVLISWIIILTLVTSHLLIFLYST